MIDTIKLVIQNFDRPINVDLYVGESRTGTYPNATQCSAQLRPILDDEKKKVYLPRVKLVTRHDIRGWTSTELTIELSIPKLLFGNNFSEVSDKDFTRFLNKLTRLMNKHWPTLKITRQDILTATVRRVDFCKNIVFYDHVSTGKVIRELGKARLNSAYDIGTIEYRNGGRAIRAHTKHRDMIVYSKIEELRASKRSESRSVEGDSWVQHKLLDKLEKKDGLNVTRVELKINTLKQLKSELDRVGLDSDKTTFFDIYSSDVAKMILSYWWDKFIGGLASSRYRKSSVEQIFSDIIVSSKTLRIALATLGYLLLRINCDWATIRNIVITRYGRHEGSRSLLAVDKSFGKPFKNSDFKAIEEITKTIDGMKPVDVNEVLGGVNGGKPKKPLYYVG